MRSSSKSSQKMFSTVILICLFSTQWFTDVHCHQQRRVNNLMRNNGKPVTNSIFPVDTNAGVHNDDKGEEEGIRVKRQAVFSPKLKYLPFKIPSDYSNLQVPTRNTARIFNFTSEELLQDLGSEMFAVSVTLRIREVNDINEIDEEITFTADIILEWTDYVIRLRTLESLKVDSDEVYREYEDMFRTLDQRLIKDIWTPDIFIENLIKVQHPQLLSPPASIRFNQVTGKFIYWTRLRIKMECSMDYHYYPADIQKCQVAIRSSNYETSEMSVFWAGPGSAAFLEDCKGTNFDLQISDVEHIKKKLVYTIGQTRQFDVIQFNILARRNMSYHVVQTYLPSIFFIVITWLCFLLPPHMIEARIGISMTTLLTLTAMFASVRESTPIVSYVRAIDIWMLACIFFIFLTLLEFTVVLWLRYMKTTLDDEEEANQKNELEEANQFQGGVEKTTEDEIEVEMRPLNEKNVPGRRKSQSRLKQQESPKRRRVEFCQLIAQFLEDHGFLLFSLLFILFCSWYWYWIIIYSDYLVWEVDEDINCPPEPEQDT